jgi:hypothetical protein
MRDGLALDGRKEKDAMFRIFQRVAAGQTLLACFAILGSGVPVLGQKQEPIPIEEPTPSPQARRKQTQDLLKANFEKMKREADDLSKLAQSLQDDLAKANENVLSLKVVAKAEKIEKLAKKIKETARGY